jgi:diadenosine tetraphosphate (Ap4A) HIT family hydrolase
MAYDVGNIFAKILNREIPCDIVYEDDHVLAFNDINPQRPVHVLVIPKGQYVSHDDFAANASDAEIAAFMRAVGQIARRCGIHETGYRLIANTGVNGGQEVPHYHVHIIGGAAVGPMVCD